MFSRIRYFFADLAHWIGLHKLASLAIALVLAGLGVGAYLLADDESDKETLISPPAPQVVIPEAPEPEETAELGFPEFATKNTTRVAAADSIAAAAAVALAVFPSTGGVPGPEAVSLVDVDDWPAAVAAASLVAAPVSAPILLTEGGDLPDLSVDALRSLAPAGGPNSSGRQLFVVGEAAKPDGFDAEQIDGSNAAEVAAAIDRQRTKLVGEPEHIVVTTSDDPAVAVPAAGWAARSGDPVLFVGSESVPGATLEALKSHKNVPVYVLGAESAIPAKLIKELKEVASTVQRVGSENPVENAIEFARYASGSFGWNINDPGHGFVIANSSRPIDAAIAAPLSASGSWGPLLITDDAEALPAPLRSYLLDLKPGYEDDPTRAVYNHVWLIGDPAAVSVDVQAQVDELAEVAPVRSGSGATTLAPAPGAAETPVGEPAAPDEKQDKADETKSDQR